MTALLLDRVTKDFGDKRAVDDLSFSVRDGEVFGFLGGNGAGKTTSLRMVLDIIRPTSGRIEILGRAPGRENSADLGFLPEERGLYRTMTALDTITYFGRLKGMTRGDARNEGRALLDEARTIFSGLIVVDPDAQKTDAYQSNRNLMLSADAESNSLPGLEIQANDVRCTHGSTTSRIDPEQEFYLQSRGIAQPAAVELLTFGFFEEVLAKLDHAPLHDALYELIQSSFGK